MNNDPRKTIETVRQRVDRLAESVISHSSWRFHSELASQVAEHVKRLRQHGIVGRGGKVVLP